MVLCGKCGTHWFAEGHSENQCLTTQAKAVFAACDSRKTRALNNGATVALPHKKQGSTDLATAVRHHTCCSTSIPAFSRGGSLLPQHEFLVPQNRDVVHNNTTGNDNIANKNVTALRNNSAVNSARLFAMNASSLPPCDRQRDRDVHSSKDSSVSPQTMFDNAVEQLISSRIGEASSFSRILPSETTVVGPRTSQESLQRKKRISRRELTEERLYKYSRKECAMVQRIDLLGDDSPCKDVVQCSQVVRYDHSADMRVLLEQLGSCAAPEEQHTTYDSDSSYYDQHDHQSMGEDNASFLMPDYRDPSSTSPPISLVIPQSCSYSLSRSNSDEAPSTT
jgi:hypothetical protein